MKRCYFMLIACISVLTSHSQNNQAILNNGKWNNNSTWGLGHSPQNGETAIVPADSTLVVDNNMQITTDITLKIYGHLVFSVGKLRLTANSVVLLYDGATISSVQGNTSDKIEIGGVAKYTGDDGILNGPLMASSSTTGFSSMPSVLPVKFVSFTVSHARDGIAVKWCTTEEREVAIFRIERSKDGHNWQTIGQVEPVKKLAGFNYYLYTDKEIISGLIYYRVKQIDLDGDFIYTSVSGIRSNLLSYQEVKISSVANTLVVNFSQEVKGNVVLRLVSSSGQLVAQQTFYQPTGNMILDQNSNKGLHFLYISNGQEVKMVKKIFLN